ncbi:response regulator transcription factor [Reinekea forsetii]|nr:response regulator transcription factor [Reinekea forsetii]
MQTDFEYANICLVEDDAGLADLTATYLESHGYSVDVIANGLEAVKRIPETNPDLVILDIMLPGLDGMAVCQKLRQSFYGPILFLTARGDSIDEILGLEIGGDDYLAKPVEPRRLLARVRAMLRRQTAETSKTFGVQGQSDFKFDKVKQEVYFQDSRVELTQPEFRLLLCLKEAQGKIVSRDDIMKTIRGIEYDGVSRTADILVSEVRKKLPQGEWIKTIRGQGYTWTE